MLIKASSNRVLLLRCPLYDYVGIVMDQRYFHSGILEQLTIYKNDVDELIWASSDEYQ